MHLITLHRGVLPALRSISLHLGRSISRGLGSEVLHCCMLRSISLRLGGSIGTLCALSRIFATNGYGVHPQRIGTQE